ncbi:MAG: phage major capsid protein, partial [Candidatus Sulfotelmatobacter sp.]
VKDAITEVVNPVAGEVKAVKDAQEKSARTVEAQATEIKTLQTQLAEAATREQKNQDALDALIKKADESAKEQKSDQPSMIRKALNDKEEELKNLANSQGSSVRFQVKAVGPISLANSFGSDVIRGFREDGISSKPYNPRFILGLVSVMFGGPGSNPISWVNRIPKEGGPAWTLEMAQKPGIDVTYAAESMTAQFLAVYTVVTKQALLSMPILEQEINSLLTNEMLNKLEQDIISGTGVAPIIKGILPYATAFTAGSLAGTVLDANDFDVIRVAIGQVLKANYFPNAVLVSIDTATSMDLTKGNNGHYVLPPFTTAEGTVVKGVRVYASNFIPDDTFLVGDMTKYLFNFVEGLTIDVGYIDKQFIENMATIRAEIFGMGRVKQHEVLAFVKGTFTAAKAALNMATP